jgi:hypothetical protein
MGVLQVVRINPQNLVLTVSCDDDHGGLKSSVRVPMWPPGSLWV